MTQALRFSDGHLPRRLRVGESKVPSALADESHHLSQVHRLQLVLLEECSPLRLLRCVFGERIEHEQSV